MCYFFIIGSGSTHGLLERSCHIGLLGHHPGDVDNTERVEAVQCPNAEGEGTFHVVKERRVAAFVYINITAGQRVWLSLVHRDGQYIMKSIVSIENGQPEKKDLVVCSLVNFISFHVALNNWRYFFLHAMGRRKNSFQR